MQIVRIRHMFFPDAPFDYFYELSARQAKKGHEVNVITWNRNACCPLEVVAPGFSVHRLSGLDFSIFRTYQNYPFLPGLGAKISLLAPNLVHIESHLFLPSIQAINEAKKKGLPCVLTIHGVFADRGFAANIVQKAFLYTFGSKLFRTVNKVICLTRSDASEISRFGCPFEKIRLIPNAIDTERFKPGTEIEEKQIVWVGRFVPEKGLKYLIEAARIVISEVQDARFLLVGYGPLKGKIKKMVKNFGLPQASVQFVGPLEREQIVEILKKASIYALPSLKEGLPLSLLEAMACEKPVICSNIPGINEVVSNGQNGILVPSKNPKALADAILLLLSDKKFGSKLGKKARKTMIKKYSWKIVIEKMEKVYNEAIREQ